MKWGSLRVRLSLWNAAVLALLLGSFGVILCLSTQDRIQGALDNEMLVRARRSAAGPPPPPWPGGPHRDMGPPPPQGGGPPQWSGPHGADGGSPGGPGPDEGPGHFRSGPGPGPGQFGAEQRPVPSWTYGSAPNSGDDFQNWRNNPAVQRFVAFLLPRFIARNGQSAGAPGGIRAAWDPELVVDSFRGAEAFSTITLNGSRVRVVSVPWRRGGEIIGAVQMARDESDYGRLWSGQWRTLWTLLPLALIGAGAAGLFLTGRALRPVHEVTLAAAQIGAEDLSRRLDATGDDEFAELARTFNAMIARLEESFERQRRFTADASHELRTPLTRIKISTSEALSGEHSAIEYRAALAVADRGADVMSRLIDQLLTLARSDAGQLPLRVVPMDLGDLLRSAAATFAHSEHAPIRLELSKEPLCVYGDEEHLIRVFVNLLENAVRHTPDSGQIIIRAGADAHTAIVQVIDNGEGIPEAALAHVGERFFRVDSARTRSRGGAGLGLAICRGIVQAHGGVMSLASRPGQGTAVTVSLPVAPDE